jgi:hypothetical protein
MIPLLGTLRIVKSIEIADRTEEWWFPRTGRRKGCVVIV